MLEESTSTRYKSRLAISLRAWPAQQRPMIAAWGQAKPWRRQRAGFLGPKPPTGGREIEQGLPFLWAVWEGTRGSGRAVIDVMNERCFSGTKSKTMAPTLRVGAVLIGD